MPELQLIGAPQSNYVWVCRIACTEKGVPYALVPAMPHTPRNLLTAALRLEKGRAAAQEPSARMVRGALYNC